MQNINRVFIFMQTQEHREISDRANAILKQYREIATNEFFC